MMHHLFDLATGLFTGRAMEASEDTRTVNCPVGFGWIAGVVDWQSQRVEGGKLVDYIPPQPDADHEWSPTRKRWVLRAEVAQQRARAAAAMAEIELLERASLRPLREVRLAELSGRAAPMNAVARLQEIEARCEVLRGDLLPAPNVSVARIETGDRP